jgi:hypothetical protein
MKRFTPKIEALEDRLTPATTTVLPGPGALQAAITAAAPGDTLLMSHGTYNGDIRIDKPLVIVGQPDADHQNPFIVGDGGTGNLEAIVEVLPGVQGVSLSHVAIGDSGGTRPIQVGILIDPGAGNFSFSFGVIRKLRDPNVLPTGGEAVTVGIKAQPGTHDITISHVALYNLHDPAGQPIEDSCAYGIWLQGVNNVAIDHTYVKDTDDVGFFINGGSTNVFLNYCAASEMAGQFAIGMYVQDSQATITGSKGYELSGTTTIGLKVSGSSDVLIEYGALTGDAYGVLIDAGFTGSFTQEHVDISGNRITNVLDQS